jgi:hypothetical protein
VEAAKRLDPLVKQFPSALTGQVKSVLPVDAVEEGPTIDPLWSSVVAWAAVEALGSYCDPGNAHAAAAELFDALRLREVIAEALSLVGMSGEDRWRAAARVRSAFAHASWAPGAKPTPGRAQAPFSWLHDPEVAWLIGVHEWEGERYFNKEEFERFLWWMALRALMDAVAAPGHDEVSINAIRTDLECRLKSAEDAGYRVEALLKTTTVDKPLTPVDSIPALATGEVKQAESGSEVIPKKTVKKKEPVKKS